MYRCHCELSDWVQNNALLAYLDRVLSCSLGSTLFYQLSDPLCNKYANKETIRKYRLYLTTSSDKGQIKMHVSST